MADSFPRMGTMLTVAMTTPPPSRADWLFPPPCAALMISMQLGFLSARSA